LVIEDWAGRFERYAARKEAEAREASIHPLTTDIERGGDRLVAIGNDWSRALFDGPFYVSPPRSPELPSTSLVFVQSRDGNTGARNPAALGGGEADKHLMYEGLSRVAADAVLAGAETVRGGNLVLSTWHPELVAIRASLGLPRHPIQVVATLRGMKFDGLIFNLPELRVILLTVPACTDLMMNELTDRPWITPVVMASSRNLVHAFRQLRTLGIRTMSCIGGRTLAGQLLDAGLIQDVYLTTSAREGGEPNTPMYSRPLDGDVVVRKHGTGGDAGVVFEMFSVSGRP
jgi:5-amino-6-(5-phosphoribosylamino)uracil reductase